MFNQLQQFHRNAVQYKLSASAILLWQYLYLTMAGAGQFVRLHQNTADLMAALNLSRKGLFQARKSLIAAGLLMVEQDKHQKLWYSLQLDGAPVQPEQPEEAVEAAVNETSNAARKETSKETSNKAGKEFADTVELPREETAQAWQQPSDRQREAEPSPFPGTDRQQGDIVMNRGYRACLQDFCNRYENISLRLELELWMAQREKNGWTLTLWGLETLLQKLVQLAAGQISAMVDIIRQSVRRRWKGFHPLKQQRRPSGAQLCKLEEKEQKTAPHWPSGKPKLRREERDLDFLTR